MAEIQAADISMIIQATYRKSIQGVWKQGSMNMNDILTKKPIVEKLCTDVILKMSDIFILTLLKYNIA